SSFLLLSFSIILPYLIVDLKLCNRTEVYNYLDHQSHREAYQTETEMIAGLRNWFDCKDIEVSESEFQQVLETGKFADNYDIGRLTRERKEFIKIQFYPNKKRSI
ncbi:hypothetical protein, partial [Enterococcus faecalis]|uniref:hypothetical protein n=1 Tax=Enterococcus faecalis TaxID=1351 RepID=UPI0035F050BC